MPKTNVIIVAVPWNKYTMFSTELEIHFYEMYTSLNKK